MVTGCPAGGAELLPDFKGSTALHLAARHGHGATAQRLCGRSNVSAPNAAGRTALHLAAWQGHLEVARKMPGDGGDKSAETLVEVFEACYAGVGCRFFVLERT